MRSILVLVFVTACTGGAATPLDARALDTPPDTQPDSVDARVDAMVDSMIDAGGIDTMLPDAPSMAELPACAVVATGVAVEGTSHLIVHASNGAAMCRLTPNVNGGGSVAVPTGGAITIVPKVGRGLLTIMDPEPGDLIDLTRPAFFQYEVTLDVPPVPGATDYRLACVGAQSFGENPDTVKVQSNCLGADNLVHSIVVARDDDFNIVAYGEVALRPTNVSFSTQGTPMPTPTWKTAMTPLTVTMTNAPPGSYVCHGVMVGGVLNAWGRPECVPAGTVAPMPTIGEALVVQTRMLAVEEETWLDARRYPIGTQSVTFDAATQALPRVLSAVFVGTTARPAVAWTTSRPIDRGSELVATASWVTNSTSTQWHVVAPIDTPSPIVFPQLPLDLQPTGALSDPELFLWDANGADYDAIRVAPFTPWNWPLFFLPRPTLATPAPSTWGLSVFGDYDPA